MTENVTFLNVPANNLAATFRDYAERAERKEIVCAAIVAVNAGEDVLTALTGNKNAALPFTMVGALDEIKFRILTEWVER